MSAEEKPGRLNAVLVQPVAGVFPQHTRDWDSRLCDCCTHCGTCCYGFCCTSCFHLRLSRRLGESYLVPCCMGRLGVISMRTKVRAMSGIKGSILRDFCTYTFCECCASTQLMKEVHYLDLDLQTN